MASQACGATDEVVEQTTPCCCPSDGDVYLWPVCEADLLSWALKRSYHPCTWVDIDCECKMIFVPAP